MAPVEMMSAVAVRHALAEVAPDVLDDLAGTDPRGFGAPGFKATQDILADWWAAWHACAHAGTTPAGRAHVDASAPAAQKVLGWLVSSVTALAFHVCDEKDDPEVAQDMVQEMLARLVGELPRFDSAKSPFHSYASNLFKYAQRDHWRAQHAFGGQAHIPSSWHAVAPGLREKVAGGMTVAQAVEAVRADLLGEPGSPDFDTNVARHIRKGTLAALSEAHAVLALSGEAAALDDPLGGSDGRTATHGDRVAARPAENLAGEPLPSRIAAMCGLSPDALGQALAARLGLEGETPTRRAAASASGVAVGALASVEAQACARAQDPLAWMVWLDPAFDPVGEAGPDIPVVW